jgi:hypothetical protein
MRYVDACAAGQFMTYLEMFLAEDGDGAPDDH